VRAASSGRGVAASDGRLGAGRSVKYGTIGVIDLSTGQLALGVDEGLNTVGSQMVFDEADRLNFRVGSPAANQGIQTRVVGFAFMVSDLAGGCWLASTQYADPIDFVLPNRK